MNKKQKIMLARILAASGMMVALHFTNFSDPLRFALYLVPYFTVGYDVLARAVRRIASRQVFDENLLMAVATVGALGLAAYGETGNVTEAIAIMLFYQIGELFQSIAVGRSRRNITDLMDIRPDYAWIEVSGQLVRSDPETVAVGTTIVVQPGEKVPIDGVVVDGISSLDTSALTGESLPRDAKEGDEILSGCINMTGVLKIKTTKEFGESTASKILELTENASSRKARSEEFISKFARWYTPTVCWSALALAVLPPLVRMLAMSLEPHWSDWIYRALTFLIISCPCALVISIPLTFFAGIGGASREGILVKGANFLETLAETKCVVFDKTGTLTQGTFSVRAVHHCSMDEKKLIEYAALAESASSHPISKSLQVAWGGPLDRTRVTEIHEASGMGITSLVDGIQVAAGNEKLMRSLGLEPIPCRSAGTIVHMAVNGQYAGHIVISDDVKPQSKEAIARLASCGVKTIVMLTGDGKRTAEFIARKLGIKRVYSELLPTDKLTKVEELLKEFTGKNKLIFVGDGINDAPVLSRADAGIAMGAIGSDAAIEAADVVLMDDDPLKVSKAIKISRKCLRIVWQNIAFALGVKGLCLAASAFGYANMWLAIFADVGVMVLATMNAIRALFVKKL